MTTLLFDELVWTAGVGDGLTTACVNSLAVLLDAERRGLSREDALAEFSDNSPCICPVVRRASILIHDRLDYWPDAKEATAWMHATAPRLLDTKGSLNLTNRRAFLCADVAMREIAPLAFDAVANKWPEASEWAVKLRAVEAIVDTRTARAAQEVAAAAAAAADNADNAALSAYAAYAASTASNAASNAAYAASNAADAAAAAADAAYAATKITKPIMLSLLDRLIALQEVQS